MSSQSADVVIEDETVECMRDEEGGDIQQSDGDKVNMSVTEETQQVSTLQL